MRNKLDLNREETQDGMFDLNYIVYFESEYIEGLKERIDANRSNGRRSFYG